MPKIFITTCVDSTAQDIGDMVDSARQITRRTFLKHVDKEEMKKIEKELGYGDIWNA